MSNGYFGPSLGPQRSVCGRCEDNGAKEDGGEGGKLREDADLSNSPPWEEAIMFSFPVSWRSSS